MSGFGVIKLAKPSPIDVSPSKQNRYTCIGCRIKFETMELQRAHYKTEWHLYNLKRRVCSLPPIDSESFDIIQAAAPKQPEEEKPRHRLSEASSSRRPDEDNGDGDDDDDWEDEEIEDEELMDEDYDDKEAEEMLARVIKPNTCLFCDKKHNNVEKNVNHMNLVHGFFIPEEQYLIDTEGLMEYLGFKVGAGCTCLWCNKQFKSVHGVRLHMIYKDHCKILYDQEKAVEEFKEFYDYSNQEHIQMKPLNELAIPKRRSERRSEYDRSLVDAKSSSSTSNSRQLVSRKGLPLAMVAGSYQAKNIKKFNAYRAKIVLRTGMANNNTMRGRLRQQNPI